MGNAYSLASPSLSKSLPPDTLLSPRCRSRWDVKFYPLYFQSRSCFAFLFLSSLLTPNSFLLPRNHNRFSYDLLPQMVPLLYSSSSRSVGPEKPWMEPMYSNSSDVSVSPTTFRSPLTPLSDSQGTDSYPITCTTLPLLLSLIPCSLPLGNPAHPLNTAHTPIAFKPSLIPHEHITSPHIKLWCSLLLLALHLDFANFRLTHALCYLSENKPCFLYNFIPQGLVTQVSALGQTVDQKTKLWMLMISKIRGRMLEWV